jgi:hypothetical protein
VTPPDPPARPPTPPDPHNGTRRPVTAAEPVGVGAVGREQQAAGVTTQRVPTARLAQSASQSQSIEIVTLLSPRRA